MQCLLHMRLCATRVGEGVHLKQERNGRAAGSEPWPIYCLSPKLSFPLVQTHQGPDKLLFPLQLYSSGQAVLKNSSCMIVFWSAAKWKISTLGIFYWSLMWWTGSDYGCSVKLWNMDLWIMIGLIYFYVRTMWSARSAYVVGEWSWKGLNNLKPGEPSSYSSHSVKFNSINIYERVWIIVLV